jgi:CRP-like cAMP-binding protein
MHLSEDDIPLVWHQLNEAHRATALQNFLETPQWHKFARTHVYHDFMHSYPTRIHESQKPLSKGAKTTVEVGLTASLIHLSRGGGYECHNYCLVTIHYMTRARINH